MRGTFQMPNPGINTNIRRAILAVYEEDRTLSAGGIRRALSARAKQQGLDSSLPTERTIARVIKAHKDASPEERRKFRYVKWPEDMMLGELPWESSGAVLQLIGYFRERGYNRP